MSNRWNGERNDDNFRVATDNYVKNGLFCAATDNYVKNGLVLTGGENPQGSGHFLLFISIVSQLCQAGVLATSQEYWNCV